MRGKERARRKEKERDKGGNRGAIRRKEKGNKKK